MTNEAGSELPSSPPRHEARVEPPPGPPSFVEALSDGVYGVDDRGLCTFVNPAALRMLGYASAGELLGRNMHEAIHHTRPDGSHFPIAACPLLHTLTSGRPVRLDNELLWRKDGTSFIADIPRSRASTRAARRSGAS